MIFLVWKLNTDQLGMRRMAERKVLRFGGVERLKSNPCSYSEAGSAGKASAPACIANPSHLLKVQVKNTPELGCTESFLFSFESSTQFKLFFEGIQNTLEFGFKGIF